MCRTRYAANATMAMLAISNPAADAGRLGGSTVMPNGPFRTVTGMKLRKYNVTLRCWNNDGMTKLNVSQHKTNSAGIIGFRNVNPISRNTAPYAAHASAAIAI